MFFLSCVPSDSYIYYNYGKTTITRVDKGNHIFFYYGKYKKKETLPKSYVEGTYSGFDGGISAFLIIKNDGNAEIIRVGGVFKEINKNNNLLLNEFESNIKFINWEKNRRGNYLNVCRLSDALQVEIKLNKDNNSNIKVIYP